eukprot:Hpha_TRINITY_DN24668_c0_g1::TRINITY_DN24668_c0_g1_i1::g.147355::m.147355
MGLTAGEVESLRVKYPDRLQVLSKLADIDTQKIWYMRMYFGGIIWGTFAGFRGIWQVLHYSRMKKGSHFRAGSPIFGPTNRMYLLRAIAHTIIGYGSTYWAWQQHCKVEDETQALWSINAVHMGAYKPRSENFLDTHFPEEERGQYATVEERMKVLKLWQNENATTS